MSQTQRKDYFEKTSSNQFDCYQDVIRMFLNEHYYQPSKSKKNACIGQKGILAIHTHRKNRNVQRTDSQAIITICMVSQAITICL